MSDKKKKPFTKREKSIAAVVTATIAAAPLLAMPAYETSAIVSPSSSPIPEMHDFVVALNGVLQPVNLRKVYGYGDETPIIVPSDHSIASYDQTLLEAGYLAIKGLQAGKATFTVTYQINEMEQTDEFIVNVLSTGSDNELDIGDMLNYSQVHPESFDTREEIEIAIGSIKPTVLSELIGDNQAPVFNSEEYDPSIELSVGESYYISDFESYFHDPDDLEESYLDFTVVSSNSEIVDTYNDGGWHLRANATGEVTITLMASDGDKISSYSYKVTVGENRPPEVLKSFDTYYISEGGSVSLDLNSYFTDFEGNSMSYKYKSLSSSDNVYTTTLESTSNLVLTPSMTNIQSIIAVDSEGQETSQNIKVFKNESDPFNTISIFDGSVLDIQIDGKFTQQSGLDYSINGEAVLESDAVTASVYNNHFLRFEGIMNGLTSLTINARDSVTNVTYADNLMISVKTRDTLASLPIFTVFPTYGNIQLSSSNPTMTALISGDIVTSYNVGNTAVTVIVDGGEQVLTFPLEILPPPL